MVEASDRVSVRDGDEEVIVCLIVGNPTREGTNESSRCRELIAAPRNGFGATLEVISHNLEVIVLGG